MPLCLAGLTSISHKVPSPSNVLLAFYATHQAAAFSIAQLHGHNGLMVYPSLNSFVFSSVSSTVDLLSWVECHMHLIHDWRPSPHQVAVSLLETAFVHRNRSEWWKNSTRSWSLRRVYISCWVHVKGLSHYFSPCGNIMVDSNGLECEK